MNGFKGEYAQYKRVLLISPPSVKSRILLKKIAVKYPQVQRIEANQLIAEIANDNEEKKKEYPLQSSQQWLFFYCWLNSIQEKLFTPYAQRRDYYRLYKDFLEAIELLTRHYKGDYRGLKRGGVLRNLKEKIDEYYQKIGLWEDRDLEKKKKEIKVPKGWLVLDVSNQETSNMLFPRKEVIHTERTKREIHYYDNPIQEVEECVKWVLKDPTHWTHIEIMCCNASYALFCMRYLKEQGVPYTSFYPQRLKDTKVFIYMRRLLDFYVNGLTMKHFIDLVEEGYIQISQQLISSIWSTPSKLWESLLRHKKGIWPWWVEHIEKKIKEKEVLRKWNQWKESIIAPLNLKGVWQYCEGFEKGHELTLCQIKSIVKGVLKKADRWNEGRGVKQVMTQLLDECPDGLSQTLSDFVKYIDEFWSYRDINQEFSLSQGRVIISRFGQKGVERSTVYVLGMSKEFIEGIEQFNIYFSKDEYSKIRGEKSNRKKFLENLYNREDTDIFFLSNSGNEEEREILTSLGHCVQKKGVYTQQKCQKQKDVLKNFKGKNLPYQTSRHLNKKSKLSLSPSRLISFSQCPYRFFLESILKVRSYEQLREQWCSPMERGNIVHEILEILFQIPVQERLQQQKRVINRVLMKWFKENPNRNSVDRIRVKKEVTNQVKELYINSLPEGQQYIQSFCEEVVEWSQAYDSVEVKWRCKLDRIDQYANRIEVIDYKTGRSPLLKERKKRSSSHQLQVLIYLWVLNRHQSMQAEGYEREKVGKLIYSDQVIQMGLSQENEEWLNNYIQVATKLMQSKVVKRKGLNQTGFQQCRYCRYQGLCSTTEEEGINEGEGNKLWEEWLSLQ